MLGLKLNHVCERGPWWQSNQVGKRQCMQHVEEEFFTFLTSLFYNAGFVQNVLHNYLFCTPCSDRPGTNRFRLSISQLWGRSCSRGFVNIGMININSTQSWQLVNITKIRYALWILPVRIKVHIIQYNVFNIFCWGYTSSFFQIKLWF